MPLSNKAVNLDHHAVNIVGQLMPAFNKLPVIDKNLLNGGFWFDKRIKIVKFVIDDLDNVENVVLSFSAPKRKGILSIKLNGELIYEYDINKLNIEPIKLKKNF